MRPQRRQIWCGPRSTAGGRLGPVRQHATQSLNDRSSAVATNLASMLTSSLLNAVTDVSQRDHHNQSLVQTINYFRENNISLSRELDKYRCLDAQRRDVITWYDESLMTFQLTAPVVVDVLRRCINFLDAYQPAAAALHDDAVEAKRLLERTKLCPAVHPVPANMASSALSAAGRLRNCWRSGAIPIFEENEASSSPWASASKAEGTMKRNSHQQVANTGGTVEDWPSAVADISQGGEARTSAVGMAQLVNGRHTVPTTLSQPPTIVVQPPSPRPTAVGGIPFCSRLDLNDRKVDASRVFSFVENVGTEKISNAMHATRGEDHSSNPTAAFREAPPNIQQLAVNLEREKPALTAGGGLPEMHDNGNGNGAPRMKFSGGTGAKESDATFVSGPAPFVVRPLVSADEGRSRDGSNNAVESRGAEDLKALMRVHQPAPHFSARTKILKRVAASFRCQNLFMAEYAKSRSIVPYSSSSDEDESASETDDTIAISPVIEIFRPTESVRFLAQNPPAILYSYKELPPKASTKSFVSAMHRQAFGRRQLSGTFPPTPSPSPALEDYVQESIDHDAAVLANNDPKPSGNFVTSVEKEEPAITAETSAPSDNEEDNSNSHVLLDGYAEQAPLYPMHVTYRGRESCRSSGSRRTRNSSRKRRSTKKISRHRNLSSESEPNSFFDVPMTPPLNDDAEIMPLSVQQAAVAINSALYSRNSSSRNNPEVTSPSKAQSRFLNYSDLYTSSSSDDGEVEQCSVSSEYTERDMELTPAPTDPGSAVANSPPEAGGRYNGTMKLRSLKRKKYK